MVLFIYVISLASNEIFNFSLKIFLISITIIMILNLIFFFYDKNLYFFLFNSLDRDTILFIKRFSKENSLSLRKLYNFPVNFISVILIIYLFLTLVAVVKITNIFEGPLRPKTN